VVLSVGVVATIFCLHFPYSSIMTGQLPFNLEYLNKYTVNLIINKKDIVAPIVSTLVPIIIVYKLL
jgi:hypothetical protein